MDLIKSKLQSAKEKFGVTVKVNKELDKLKGKELFPEKTKKINKLVSKLDLK